VGLAVVQKLIEKLYPNLYTYVKEDAKVDEEISTKQLVSDDTLMVGFHDHRRQSSRIDHIGRGTGPRTQ
jgi:hypothetical protein